MDKPLKRDQNASQCLHKDQYTHFYTSDDTSVHLTIFTVYMSIFYEKVQHAAAFPLVGETSGSLKPESDSCRPVFVLTGQQSVRFVWASPIHHLNASAHTQCVVKAAGRENLSVCTGHFFIFIKA